MSTEITLLEERLAAGTGDARKTKASAAALTETLPTANVLGDVDALAARLAGITKQADATAAADRSRRDEHRATQTAHKEALAAEAEELASSSTQWKIAGDRLRAILDEWKTVSGLDRKTDDALWKRYSAARETFNRRRGSHFAELDRERAGAREAKERLCVKAEELVDSTDWGTTSAEFRKLLVEWKAAGRTARDVDDALWNRFKAAQDTFFKARNAATTERDAESNANATAKEALLAQAERIDTSNHEAARAAFRSIGDKWDAIGNVPRERSAELDRRLRAVEKKVRDAASSGSGDWYGPGGPSQSGSVQRSAPSSTSRSAQPRPKRPVAPRTPSRPGPTPTQWREWAEAAVRGTRQASARRLLPVSASRDRGRHRAFPVAPGSVGAWQPSAGAPLRRPAAPIGARPHHPAPSEMPTE